MKRLSLEGVYEYGLLGVLFLIVLHAPISVAFGSVLPQLEDVIKAWKEIALAVLVILMIVLAARRKLWRSFFRQRVLLVCGAFIVLHVIYAVLSPNGTLSIIAGLMIDLRFVAMFVLMFVLLRLRPDALRRVLRAVVAGAVIVIGFGLLQITVLPDNILSYLGYSKQTIAPYVTIDSNPEFVRINSTLRGPNPLGALMVVYGSLALAYVMLNKPAIVRQWRQAAAGGIASLVVLIASFSRSAYIAAFISVAVISGLLVRFTRKRVALTVAGGVAVFAGLALLSSTDWYSNVILHEDPESVVTEKSNAGHVDSLADGASRVVRQPFGAGVGSTGSASLYDDSASNDFIIENYYFFVAHEVGWIGMILFVAMNSLVLVGLWRKRSGWLALGMLASGVGLAFAAVLLPVWADETVALSWWGLAGAALASSRGIMEGNHAAATRQQKTTRTA